MKSENQLFWTKPGPKKGSLFEAIAKINYWNSYFSAVVNNRAIGAIYLHATNQLKYSSSATS